MAMSEEGYGEDMELNWFIFGILLPILSKTNKKTKKSIAFDLQRLMYKWNNNNN